MTVGVAQLAAETRATQGLKTPDALRLATAVECGAKDFLTNDRDFGVQTALRVMRLDELEP